MVAMSERQVKSRLDKARMVKHILVIVAHSVFGMSEYNKSKKDVLVQRMAEWSMTHRIVDVVEPKKPTDDDMSIDALIVSLEESKNHMTNITADVITSILDKII